MNPTDTKTLEMLFRDLVDLRGYDPVNFTNDTQLYGMASGIGDDNARMYLNDAFQGSGIDPRSFKRDWQLQDMLQDIINQDVIEKYRR